MAEARQVLSPEQARRRRRRSVALAVGLAALVVLFYVMAVMHGPSIVSRPI
jgi:ferric-dicitrate binding protein FerR (iron transport regulator)